MGLLAIVQTPAGSLGGAAWDTLPADLAQMATTSPNSTIPPRLDPCSQTKSFTDSLQAHTQKDSPIQQGWGLGEKF